jgi:CRISPR-associated endonuclease/helicase Cas3
MSSVRQSESDAGVEGERDVAAAYFAAARGRPAWAMWGKARPASDGSPAHPLLCHLLDVAAVAERLLDRVLPRGAVTTLCRGFSGAPLEEARAWIAFVVALHDLGKATPGFQAQWGAARSGLAEFGLAFGPPRLARPHGTVGVHLATEALARMGFDALAARRLARAVGAHHGMFPNDYDVVTPPMSRAELGPSSAWEEARVAIVATLKATFGLASAPTPRVADRDWAFLSALAGLTAVADWVGSIADVFVYEFPPQSAVEYVETARARALEVLARVGFRPPRSAVPASFEGLFGVPPRPLQAAMEQIGGGRNRPICVVVEAPMGEGKTEAALFLSHALAAAGLHDGTFLGLPTQATANQMFDRLAAFLAATRSDDLTNLQLLHGEAVHDTRVAGLLRSVHDEAAGPLVCEEWFLGKKRGLLAPFSAGTVDQALLGVLRTRHAFVRQLGLAGKTVVLDEVHAYDTYTSTLLDRLVAWLGALGASVVILSATLPAARRRDLLSVYAGQEIDAPAPAYPRISWVDGATAATIPLQTSRPGMDVGLQWVGAACGDLPMVRPESLREGGVVAVVRNTVARAQSTFRLLKAARASGVVPRDTELLLLHARFPAEDRRRLEAALVSRLGPRGSRPVRMIVVGTQVLEQSLDVDFDAMVTDLAPVDLVLQRAGRLHRHARPARPAAFVAPRLWIAAPSGDAGEVNLREVASVYPAYIVRRSLMTLRERGRLHLPNDIEPLVDAVYEETSPSIPCLDRERSEFEAEVERQHLLARSRAWKIPRVSSDPFADMGPPLAEDAPDVARMLRADTRLGEPGAEIVCLFGSWHDAQLHRDGPRFDLDASCSLDLVRALANRTVRVSVPGVSRLVDALPVPDSWRRVSTLARRRPLLFGQEPIRLGSYAVSLDDELGLVLTRHPGADDAVVLAGD